MGIDIQDDLGRHEVGFIEDTSKLDINNGEGCRMKTIFKINKGFYLDLELLRVYFKLNSIQFQVISMLVLMLAKNSLKAHPCRKISNYHFFRTVQIDFNLSFLSSKTSDSFFDIWSTCRGLF